MKNRSLFLILLLAVFMPWAANGQKPVPYNEGFESMSSASDLTAAGWITYFEHSSSFVAITTADHSEGSKSLDMDNWNASDNKYQVVGLPVLEEAINTLQITVSFNISTVGTFSVGYLTSATDANTFVEIENWTNSGWQTKTVNLSSVPNGAARIALKYYRYWRCYVDDIKVKRLPTCLTPTFTASNVTTDGTTANLTWTAGGTESSWSVAHSTSSTADPDDCIIDDNVTILPTTTSPYPVPSLALGDHYFWVRANCDGNDHSDWVGPVSMHIGYCTPNPSSVDGQGITNVTFGTGDYIVNNSNHPTSAPYYGDYTSMVGAYAASTTATVDITYTTGSTSSSGTIYSYGTIIWVDWNNNMSFEDNEIVTTGTSPQVSNGTPQSLSLSFVVPVTQATGDYRMRIAAADSYFDNFIGGDATANHSPCFSSTYAVCHDYTLRVTEAPSCTPVADLEAPASGLTHNQAYITWTSIESGWDIVWDTDPDFNPDDVASPTYVTETHYTIQSLQSVNDYYVYVRSNCGSGQYSTWSSKLHFKTTPYAEPVGDSWADNFEGNDCGWTLVNGTVPNQWAWGTATNNGGTHALYISNDGGISNAYNINTVNSVGANSMVYATKLFAFANTKYTFKYDWKAYGESSSDYLRVALVPATVELAAGTSVPSGFSATTLPTGWIAIDGGSKLNLQTEWQLDREEYANVPGGSYYVVFAWRNDGSAGTQPPAAIDNFSITRVTCPYDVEDLAVATNPAVMATTATVTWTAGEATQWQVAYSAKSNFPDGETTTAIVSQASYNMTSLNPATNYYVKVRAYCGDSDYGVWCNAISFHTDCPNAYDLPHTWDFEGPKENNLPLCWTRMGSSTTYPMLSSSQYHEGSYSLYFYNTNSDANANEIAVLPAVNSALKNLRVKFYAKTTNTGTVSIKVGYVTSLTDATSFEEVASKNLSTSFDEFMISFKNVGDATGYIAFRTIYNGSSNTTIYVDDVTVEEIPNCAEPLDLIASNEALNGVTLSWTQVSDETAWDIFCTTDYTLVPDASTVPTVSSATTNPYTITTGLNASSHYFAYVRAHCDDTEQSAWSVACGFNTLCEEITITDSNPYTQDFEGYGGTIYAAEGIVPVCWDHHAVAYQTYTTYAPHIINSGSYYYHHGDGNSLTFYGKGSCYAALPEFSNDLTTLQISFWLQTESPTTGTLTLGYLTGEDDGTFNTFTAVPDVTIANNKDSMVLRGPYYLSNLPATATRLAFRWTYESSSSWTCCIDDVEVSIAPSCLPIKTLTTSNLKAHSVDLGWTLNDNQQTSFDVQYSTDANFTEGEATHLNEGVSLTNGVYNLSGLTANTPYYVRVRGNCGSEDGVSEWCTPINFTTAIGNPAPSGLAVDDDGYGPHSIRLKWTNGGGDYETSWEIAYSTYDDFNPDEVTPVSANTNPFTLTGLNHNTTYYGYVRSNCGTDGMSAWSAKQSFSTLNATNTPTLNAATDITSGGATISWTAPANNDHHQSYELYYSIENTTPGATPEAGDNYIQGITATSHDITGLTQLTKYYVWVRDICGEDGNSPWSTTPASFTTLQTPVVIDADHDFTDNFEGENCNWVLVNGTLTNKWVHGTATNNGGDKAMYVSNDDGTTNAYTNGNTVVYATKLFTLAEGTYTYSYDWKANGETTSGTPYDYLRVALVPSTVTLTAGESLPSGLNYSNMPSGWIALDGGSQLNKQTDWASHNAEITITTAGNYMVVFIWRNDNSSAYQTPAAIDNFHIGVSLCNIPADLAASVTSTSATITWTSTNNNFTLKYKKTSESIWSADIPVTGTSYTLDNVLEPQTAYNVEVVSNCSEGDSDPATLSFTTAYGIPFVETFTTSSIPANWARYSGSVANAFNGTNPSTTTGGWVFDNNNVFGQYHTSVNIWNDYKYWLTTPNIYLTTATDASKLYLVFDLAITDYNNANAPGSGSGDAPAPGDDDQFRVLVSTDNGATWTEDDSWVWMNAGGDYVYSDIPHTGQTVMLPLSAYASGSVMIAFYAESGSGTSADFDIHIDNVYVGEAFTKPIEAHKTIDNVNYGWYLIASPVDEAITPSNGYGFITDNLGANATAETATYDLYYFDQTGGGADGNGKEWKNYRANNFNIVNGTGYLYASKNGTTLTFTGTPYTGNGEVQVTYSNNAQFAGWNLIGNPFSTEAYLVNTNDASSAQGLAYYRMNSDGNDFEEVANNAAIAPMEGIFYQATAAGTVYFSKTAPAGAKSGNLNMMVSQGRGTKDNAIIRFGEGNIMEKFSFREGSTKLYIPQDGKDYAVVNADNQGEMPVNFKAEENGTYSLSFNAEEVTFVYLHLIDNKTGNDIDLLETPSYTFNATTTDYESRFKLVFCTGINDNSDSFAFCSNGNWIISNEGQATLQVIDVTGRILSSETVNGSVSKAINAVPGVYMLRLINGDNVKVQKIVVR